MLCCLFSLSLLLSLSSPRCHTVAHEASVLDQFPVSACHNSPLPWPCALHGVSIHKMTVGLNTSHLVISIFQTILIFSPEVSSVWEHLSSLTFPVYRELCPYRRCLLSASHPPSERVEHELHLGSDTSLSQ